MARESKKLKVMAFFGLRSKKDLRSDVQLSDLNRTYGDVTDEVLELYSTGILHVSPQEDRDEILSLEKDHTDAAESIDEVLHLDYCGNAEAMAEEERLADFIDDPDWEEELEQEPVNEDRNYPYMRLELDTNSYALAIYPFGNASINGSKNRELMSSAVKEMTGKDLSTELEVLETQGFLKNVYRKENGNNYYRLAENQAVRNTAENVAAILNKEYGMNFKQFYAENERKLL